MVPGSVSGGLSIAPVTELVRSLAASYYTDPSIYDVERREIFSKEWQCVGFSYQVNRSGDFLSEVVAGWPIFVQRSNDGVLRAFHNICPHRAGPIVIGDSGTQGNLVCRYHGWAFDQKGSLLNARDFGAEVPPETCLTSVRVDEWRGIVFVNLAAEGPSLIDWLGGWTERMAEWPIEGALFHTRSVRRMECNWKTYGDNFLEGYHVPLIHPGLARQTEATKYRVWNHGDRRWNIHLTPHPDEALQPGTFMCFWPNFSMDIFPGGWCTERWLPRGPHTTDLVFDYFFFDDCDEADEIVKESEEVAEEDAVFCNLVQRNLDAGLYQQGVLSPRHENGLMDWHEMYLEVLADGGPGKAVGPNPQRNPTS